MPKRRAIQKKAKNFLKSGIIGQAVTGIGAAALIGTVINKDKAIDKFKIAPPPSKVVSLHIWSRSAP